MGLRVFGRSLTLSVTMFFFLSVFCTFLYVFVSFGFLSLGATMFFFLALFVPFCMYLLLLGSFP